MTVVIDVGAARYSGDYSMERLIEQFTPTHLYAIDPNPALIFPEITPEAVTLIHAAAWIVEGEIGFKMDGLNSWVTLSMGESVPCIDLANFIDDLWLKHQERMVLKLDCEGSEYDLLPHLMYRHCDELLDLILVEWHPNKMGHADYRRTEIEQRLKCEVREWPY